MPQFGRNLPYVSTFAIYVILTVPTSLVDNFGGLMTLRFLLGLFGSPCLANRGASMGVRVYLPRTYIAGRARTNQMRRTFTLCSTSPTHSHVGRSRLRCASPRSLALWLLRLRRKLALVAVGDTLDGCPDILALLFLLA